MSVTYKSKMKPHVPFTQLQQLFNSLPVLSPSYPTFPHFYPWVILKQIPDIISFHS